MARKKKEHYATDADLAWFNSENYAGLLGRADPKTESLEEKAACHLQWATLVRDRVELERFFDSGEFTYVSSLFEKIKQAPLAPLGFSKTYSGAAHAANSATVKAMTTNRIEQLRTALIQANAPERSIVDVVLQQSPNSPFNEYVHLMVNITATDKQLIRDFKAWLVAWRLSTARSIAVDYREKIASWHSTKVLQYHDLLLFTKISGKEVYVEQRFSLLSPVDKEQRRRLATLRKTVFSNDTAQRLTHLAEGAQQQLSSRRKMNRV